MGQLPESVGSSSATPNAREWLVLFLVGLALFGVVCTVFLSNAQLRAGRTQDWVATPCTILESSLVAREGSRRAVFTPRIVYRYEVAGQAFVSDRVELEESARPGSAAQRRLVARFQASQSTVCYVDPQDPSEAVLHRPWAPGWIGALFPLLFVAVALAVGRQTLREMRSQPGAAPLLSIPRLRPRLGTTDLSQPVAMTSTWAMREAVPAAAGPIQLESGSRPGSKVAFFLLFTLLWNGVSVPLLGPDVLGLLRGQLPSLVPGLVGVVFLSVGAVAFGIFVHQLLAWSNPRPELTLDTARLEPGTRTQVRWRIAGTRERLEGLTLLLEGRELATYGRGTDVVTDAHVFARETVVDTGRRSLLDAGHAPLQVPESGMPSFQAAHNSIQWVLVVREAIRGWPDRQEEFVLWVHPKEVRA